MASSERFGFEWNKYSKIDSRYQDQFKNWTYPLVEEDFKDKEILDAGCGMGRNSFWPLMWGAKHITAFDFDKRSLAAAEKTLEKFTNKEILYKNIHEFTWQDKFDLAFSIGVIHHLEDPKKALRNIVNSLKQGGGILVWVYSYEGNEWIVKLVDPVRIHITSKLPVRLVHFLSYFCSVPLWVFVKIFRGPNGYLRQLSTFKFWHLHSIVFDQLIPTIAHYWSKEEVQELFSDVGLNSFTVSAPPNGSGWIIHGTK